MYSIIEVPFHLGLPEVAVGKGPKLILQAGADQVLQFHGIPAPVTHVRLNDFRSKGDDSIIDVNRLLKKAVSEAIAEETVPVVLAGNCNSCLGTLAGIEATAKGIVWLDAHGDYNTPETTISGALEGMSLAMALGHCHDELRERSGLLEPVPEHNVVLAAVRDLDPAEQDRLAASSISIHAADSLALFPAALEDLKGRVDAVYLHIDIDFTYPNGVPTELAEQLIRAVMNTLPVSAVALTNYNPDIDSSGNGVQTALKLLSCL